MKLQGMSDQLYNSLINVTVDIQYLIIKGGGMATKSKVEDELMRRFDLDRPDAHTLTNSAEERQDFMVGHDGVRWIAKRPEPCKTCEECGLDW